MKHVSVCLLALCLFAVPCLAQQEQEAAPEPLAGRAVWEEPLYFSVGFGFGMTFPVGLMGEIMDLGSSVKARALLNFNFPWGALGFGLYAGAMGQTVTEEATSPYNLGAFPLALEVRYETRFLVPFYFFGAFSAGVVINTITYRDSFYDERSRTLPKTFFAPSVGFGVHVTREFGVSLWGALPVIVFEGTAYTGITAGIEFEYTL